MGVLLLVRHGQARAWEADYDRLSPLGHDQSRLLGEHWASWNLRVDHVYVGPRRRHRETHDAVAAVYRDRGLPWPAPSALEHLDEFPAELVLRRFLPELVGRVEGLAAAAGVTPDPRTAERILQIVCRAWARAEVAHPDVETWRAFRERVAQAIADMIGAAKGPGKTVVAFTSGGPAAVAAGLALGSTDEKIFDLVWMMRNSAQAELLFSGERLTLRAFNATPHLPNPTLVTYR
jgi:broad specificity phosphatase PhoE